MKWLLIFLVLSSAVLAKDDDYFSVRDNDGPYSVMPGKTVNVSFVLHVENLDFRNVTAYLSPCPVGWVCPNMTFRLPEGDNNVSLSMKVAPTAMVKRYTLYILLSSEYYVTRGNDRLLIDVISEDDARTMTVEEYRSKGAPPPAVNPAASVVIPLKEPEPSPEKIYQPPDDDFVVQNYTQDVSALETIHKDSQFWDYASFVLILLLVFIGVGAYISFRKKEE